MNSKVEQARGPSAGDVAKYVLAALLVAAGVVAFYWFEQWPSVLRGLAVVAGVIAGLALFATTVKGAQTREFLYEARFELRKVVWPTRQEALRTTWVVMLAVVIISLMLGAFDWVIQLVIKQLLGA